MNTRKDFYRLVDCPHTINSHVLLLSILLYLGLCVDKNKSKDFSCVVAIYIADPNRLTMSIKDVLLPPIPLSGVTLVDCVSEINVKRVRSSSAPTFRSDMIYSSVFFGMRFMRFDRMS